eukprot:jgi/Ulvmu1/5727/UM240_0002.1
MSTLQAGFVQPSCDVRAARAAGVHQIAVLRMLADAAGAGAPLRASATASYHAQRGLSNPDTLVGSVEWESGLRTGVSITLVAAYTRWSLSASGESGTVEVSRGAWNGRGENMRHELCYRTTAADEMVCRQYSIDSMERELEAFLRAAATWRSGAQHDPALAAEVAKGPQWLGPPLRDGVTSAQHVVSSAEER